MIEKAKQAGWNIVSIGFFLLIMPWLVGQFIILLPVFFWGLIGYTKGSALAPLVAFTALCLVWLKPPSYLDYEGQREIGIILFWVGIAFTIAAYINYLYLSGAWNDNPKLKEQKLQRALMAYTGDNPVLSAAKNTAEAVAGAMQRAGAPLTGEEPDEVIVRGRRKGITVIDE